MKTQIIYTLFVTCFCAVLCLNYSGGPAANGAGDCTGSPLSAYTCAANGCHGGGSFAPVLSVALLQNGDAVTQYAPNGDYTLRLTVTAGSGTPNSYGFQTVALRGQNNDNAGAFNNPPTGFRISNFNARQYAEHNSRRPTNTMEINWKAPAAGVGPVRFYASGNAVNGNGSTSGDSPATLATPLTINEQGTSAIFGITVLPAKINAYPNPVASQLNLKIQLEKSGQYWLSIYDLTGKEFQRKAVQLLNGENTETLDVRELATGLYVVRLSDGKRIATQQIVKQ